MADNKPLRPLPEQQELPVIVDFGADNEQLYLYNEITFFKKKYRLGTSLNDEAYKNQN